ncbi:MAG: Gfo/Idh/MocA family oxidoreductase [Spirochaetaceae bacterium]|nr:Gfo/Idh/MocA family oxidoreductase [Spirochaetaceae bacterium]
MKRLRIAVIGLGAGPGSRARHYLATIARLTDHFELAAVCDHSTEVLAEIAALYPLPARFRSQADLFAAGKPDVVLSLAPKDSHVVMALTAARHGAHVITEVPVALTRRYAAAIEDACRRAGVLWETAEQVWLWPVERMKRMVIEAGLLGELTHARLRYLTGQYHGFSGVRALLGADATEVLGYCGEVKTEPYVAYGGEPESTVQWDHGLVKFASGVVCLFEKPPRIFPSARHACPVGWEVEGTRGHISGKRVTRYSDGRTAEVAEQYREAGGERVLESVRCALDPELVWENPFIRYGIGDPDDVAKASILVGLHRAITEGGAPPYGARNGLRDWEICLAVRESARLGNRWVNLPLENPTVLEQRIEAEFVRRYGHDPIEETEALLDAPFSRSATLWPVAHWL